MKPQHADIRQALGLRKCVLGKMENWYRFLQGVDNKIRELTPNLVYVDVDITAAVTATTNAGAANVIITIKNGAGTVTMGTSVANPDTTSE